MKRKTKKIYKNRMVYNVVEMKSGKYQISVYKTDEWKYQSIHSYNLINVTQSCDLHS